MQARMANPALSVPGASDALQAFAGSPDRPAELGPAGSPGQPR